jgi:predicted anti-sigma-YlaC factor YlaD
MNCKLVQDRLLLDLAGELEPQESQAIDHHLSECAECRQTAKELGDIQEIMDKALLTDVRAPENLECRVMHTVCRLQQRRFRWRSFLPIWNWRRSLTLAAALSILSIGYLVGYQHASRLFSLRVSQPAGRPSQDVIVRTRRPGNSAPIRILPMRRRAPKV